MNKRFLIDPQTTQDIQLFEVIGRSIWGFFNHAITAGGEDFLREVFLNPLSDVDAIKQRQLKIRRLEPVVQEDFPFYRMVVMDVEKYIKRSHSGERSGWGLLDLFVAKAPIYYYKVNSILETCDFLLKSQVFYEKVNANQAYDDIAEMIQIHEECLSRIFKGGPYNPEQLKINRFNLDVYDRLIRYELASKLKQAIAFFYEIDAYFAVARTAKEYEFCYPEIYPKHHTGKIHMQDVYHIFHQHPVKNTIQMTREKRIWYLTGANMAGKSSFIKTISTALYLTHIGFPAPASSVKTDLIDGVFTSINLQDNLELGYSHFYAEAVRLKEIVDQLEKNTNALIILDELFKGTNHIDASNAIFDIMEHLSHTDGPYVIVSSHITDLAEKLKSLPLVDFYKMNIESDEQGEPRFTYKIVSGIADEKLGMWLLQKSGVFQSIARLKELP